MSTESRLPSDRSPVADLLTTAARESVAHTLRRHGGHAVPAGKEIL